MSSVKIKCNSRVSTDLAILVNDGQQEVWVPFSMIEEVVTEPGVFGDVVVAIVVPSWVAREKRLTVEREDTGTVDMFGGAA